ncbi:MAG: YHS domain-containing protein [Planctomycetota bacterium]|jgi:YHS domain-containing protein
MNSKTKQFEMACLLAGLLIVGLIALNGCKKSEPAPTEMSADTMQGHEGHEHAAMMEKPAEAVAAVVEQTTCPIMGGAIDKAVFVEYQGKKVYFCCPGCEDKFKEDPEKYIAKLPQFKI